MSWREKLRPASFRGVPFFVDDTSTSTGRKIQLHEYPKRDLPYSEDLGKVSKSYAIRAFVVGEDCFEQRDALLDALEQEGGGTLVHPTLGTINVKAGACRFSDARTQGGVVRFDLVFYPGDEIEAPTATVNSSQQIIGSGKTFVASAKDRFSSAIADINFNGVNLRALGESLDDLYTTCAEEFSDFSSVVGDAASFVSIAANNPSLLPSYLIDSVASEFGFSGAVNSLFQSYGSTLSSLNAISSSLSNSNSSSKGGEDTAKLSKAVSDLVNDSLVLKGAGEVAQLPVATKPTPPSNAPTVDQQAQQEITRPDVPVADDVIDARENFSEAVWQASMDADAEHFTVTNDLRQTVYKHMCEVAKAGVSLVSVDLNEVTPALVIAWRQWHDATRSAEVTQRNNIIHPGFVSDPQVWLAQK